MEKAVGKTIDIFVIAGDNSPEYAILLRRTMMDLASGEFQLNFKCIVNSDDFDVINGWETVEITRPNRQMKHFKGIGSYRHGMQLNKIHQYVNSDYVLIADADTAVLAREWDKTMTYLLRKQCAIVGVESSKNNDRYLRFPCAIFFMSPASIFKDIKPDFLPAFKTSKGMMGHFQTKSIFTMNDQRKWKYPYRTTFRCDTGWRLPFEFRSRGYGSHSFVHEDNLSRKRMNEEYETWLNADKPFVSHAGWSRSSTHKKFLLWNDFIQSLLHK